MEELPDEEVNRQGPEGSCVWLAASVPMELSCATLLAHRCVHQPGNSPNPVLLEFSWRLHHVGMIDYELNL